MANDKIHDAVVTALKKDDWHILHENFSIRYAEFEIRVDVVAEYPAILAEKDNHQVLVEIKTFGGRSFIKQLQYAIGQYVVYRNMLTLTEMDYELFLAVEESVYEKSFLLEAASQIVRFNQLNLLVVNVNRKEIVRWIKQP